MDPSMARKGRRRRTANFGVIPQDPVITLSTLADDTVISGSALTLTQDFHWKSCDVESLGVRNQTPGEGPVLIGIAAPELTVVEIEESIDAVPTSQYDYPAVEHARRPVRVIGMFPSITADENLSQGEYRKRQRLGRVLRIPAGKELPQIFAYNRSGGPLTTGGVVLASLKHYGTWQ